MEDKKKLLRITTVPISLQLLISGQMCYVKANGLDVVAVSADGPEIVAVQDREGVRHEVIPFTRTIAVFQDLKCLWLLIRLIRREHPTIIHTHTPKAGLIGMLAGWICRVPRRIHTVAGLPMMESQGVTYFILFLAEWLTYATAHVVLSNSHRLKEYMLAHFSHHRAKIQVLGAGSSNGIDTHFFSPSEKISSQATRLREDLGISHHGFVWLFVGRLVGDKGIHELIEAFIFLSGHYKNQYLVLVGAFENEKDAVRMEVRQQIEDHPRILSVGFQNDVRPWFQLADAFTFPSYREGFPNVILQAAAMSLPIIASDINGCNEIITHGENGLLVPAKNTEKLRDEMRKLLETPALLDRLRLTVRSTITATYDQKQIWKSIYDLYQAS